MRSRVLIAIVAVLGVLGAACGDDGAAETAGTEETTTSSAGATTSSTTSTSTTDPEGGDVDVRVYFVGDEAVATAGRTVEGPAVGRGAVEALLTGPQGVEVEIGQVSEIPAGTELLDIDVTDGLATADLSGDFEAGGGSLSMQLRVAQLVFTLTQFDSVDRVDITIDGEAVEAIGGEGVPAVGLDRTDFAAVTPLVLVESPVPGQEVTSPLEIRGMANTFEATVNYTVTGADGLVLDEGFTTATAGNGTFGTFSVTSEFPGASPGVGSVRGFALSAQDGAPVDVYEVPVGLG
jgi:hypothetical protein